MRLFLAWRLHCIGAIMATKQALTAALKSQLGPNASAPMQVYATGIINTANLPEMAAALEEAEGQALGGLKVEELKSQDTYWIAAACVCEARRETSTVSAQRWAGLTARCEKHLNRIMRATTAAHRRATQAAYPWNK